MIKNSKGYRCGFRAKKWGTSSPHVKPTGDFGNAIEVIYKSAIVSRFVFSREIRRSATFDFCNTIGPKRHFVQCSDLVGIGG